MIWLIMIYAGFLTYLTRFSMFSKSFARWLPGWIETPLYYVPITMLTAIIVPEVLLIEGSLNFSLSENLRLIAASFAIVVALITRSVFITILSGLICLWIFHVSTAIHCVKTRNET